MEGACDQSVRTNFLQLCRQLDNFVEGIFQVDDTLAKISHLKNEISIDKKS
jgi:hypothetical protein